MAVVTNKKHTRKDEVREIIRAEDQWEPIGHTPMPEIPDLRNWDMRLMKTYKPFYAPMCDLCCFCTYGKCDLTGDKRGACGIDISTQHNAIDFIESISDFVCVRRRSSSPGANEAESLRQNPKSLHKEDETGACQVADHYTR